MNYKFAFQIQEVLKIIEQDQQFHFLKYYTYIKSDK